jgi:hypothetical protein
MQSETIIYRSADGIAEIRLNRPERLNAVTQQLYDEVNAALGVAEADRDVRVVLLTGEGRAFCVGADLKAHKAGRTAFERRQYLLGRAASLQAAAVVVEAGRCRGQWFCARRRCRNGDRFGLHSDGRERADRPARSQYRHFSRRGRDLFAAAPGRAGQGARTGLSWRTHQRRRGGTHRPGQSRPARCRLSRRGA